MACVVLAACMVAAPVAWRPVLRTWGPSADRIVASYLPALEPSRERDLFNPAPIAEIKDIGPRYVIVGDSMAGRVDPDHLTRLTGEATARVVQNSTGSAYWYLAIKNYVIASGARPTRIFVFFRDTNLTDPLFRLDGPYRFHIDEVARDLEPELNQVVAARLSTPWYRLHSWLDRAYAIERTRGWIDRGLTAWPADVVRGRDGADVVLGRVNNAFSLERLRTMEQADLAAADESAVDFGAQAPTSLLPAMLALAREHGFRLCFVRVLRRPINGAPPPESAALARYVADLRAYVKAGGADLIDDRDDRALAGLAYGDGDHITEAAREEYTTRFVEKIRGL